MNILNKLIKIRDMKLTGKCKEDFEIFALKYFRQERKDYDKFKDSIVLGKFNRMTDVLKNALITEWFDSIGIYIEIAMYDVADDWDAYVNKEWVRTSLNNRSEATDEAIKIANETYNNQKPKGE